MRRRPRSNTNPSKQTQSRRPFTAADVRLLLSSPLYAYGINLLPAEKVAEEVMNHNSQLAREMRETGIMFTLDDLDQRFQAVMQLIVRLNAINQTPCTALASVRRYCPADPQAVPTVNVGSYQSTCGR